MFAQSEILSALARQDGSASCGSIKNKSVSDQEWPEELHKPIIRKLEKWKVPLSLMSYRQCLGYLSCWHAN